jgi:hypothetical protein
MMSDKMPADFIREATDDFFLEHSRPPQGTDERAHCYRTALVKFIRSRAVPTPKPISNP